MKSISFLYYRKIYQIGIQTMQSQSHQNSFLKCYRGAGAPSPLMQCLRNSVGFSHERALEISRRLKNRGVRNPDSVVAFLKSRGFSESHIQFIIAEVPHVLQYKYPETRLGPKINFFREKGLSETDVVSLIVSNPSLLITSIEGCIKPTLGIIHGLRGMDKFQIELLKRSMILDLEKIAANVAVLKSCDVSDNWISRLLVKQSMTFGMDPEKFSEVTKTVKEMGFDPSTGAFVKAVCVIMNQSRSIWDKKFEVYKSFSWSNEEILHAFRKNPWCISLSEEEIKKGLNFFMKELGWSASYIAACPSILSRSLQKRVMPRHRYFQVLVLKGLINKDEKITSKFFLISEHQFLLKYVMKHKAEVPEILKIYEGSIRLKEQDGEESMFQQL